MFSLQSFKIAIMNVCICRENKLFVADGSDAQSQRSTTFNIRIDAFESQLEKLFR